MNLKILAGALLLAAPSLAQAQAKKHRIFIVSSYHREYLWDQDLQDGTCAGLMEAGALEKADCDKLAKDDAVETANASIKKAWMNTKRITEKPKIAEVAANLKKEIDAFKPDVILVSDDNGTNYMGNLYKDSKTPVVFCGVDETPVKYGLVDSADKPGHNITGVYQRGYYKDAAQALMKIAPGLKTFGVLSDDSESAMFKAKGIQELVAAGEMPLKFVEHVHTNSLKEFKAKALELAKKVDAILLVNHNTLKDDDGKTIDQMMVGNWYLANIKKPDFSSEKQFVQEGVLVVAEDSAYRQAYGMVKMAYRILKRGDKPGEMPTQRPPRGPIIVNRARAQMLKLSIDNLAEQYIDKSLALEAKN
jgi:putative tryptophan/tyrosine transport system substrate-binding protein